MQAHTPEGLCFHCFISFPSPSTLRFERVSAGPPSFVADLSRTEMSHRIVRIVSVSSLQPSISLALIPRLTDSPIKVTYRQLIFRKCSFPARRCSYRRSCKRCFRSQTCLLVWVLFEVCSC